MVLDVVVLEGAHGVLVVPHHLGEGLVLPHMAVGRGERDVRQHGDPEAVPIGLVVRDALPTQVIEARAAVSLARPELGETGVGEARALEPGAAVARSTAGVEELEGAHDLDGREGVVVAPEELVPGAGGGLEGRDLEGADGVGGMRKAQVGSLGVRVGRREQLLVLLDGEQAHHQGLPDLGQVAVLDVCELVVSFVAAHLLSGGDREHGLDTGQTGALVEDLGHVFGQLVAGGRLVGAIVGHADAPIPEHGVEGVQVEERCGVSRDAYLLGMGPVDAEPDPAGADGQDAIIVGAEGWVVAGHTRDVAVAGQLRIEGQHPPQLDQLVVEVRRSRHRFDVGLGDLVA